MPAMTEFEMSRVYGRGWNAGKRALSDGSLDLSTIDMDTINPYETAEARERWATGFTEALRSSRGSIALRRSPPAAADAGTLAPAQQHRLRIGQVVTLSATVFERGTSESFKILRLMPIENGVAQYRLKNLRDGHERVADESRLKLSS